MQGKNSLYTAPLENDPINIKHLYYSLLEEETVGHRLFHHLDVVDVDDQFIGHVVIRDQHVVPLAVVDRVHLAVGLPVGKSMRTRHAEVHDNLVLLHTQDRVLVRKWTGHIVVGVPKGVQRKHLETCKN